MDGDSSLSAETTVKPISSGEEYIESLRGRGLKVYLFGELVDEPVDHPMIRPSINAVAKTYDLVNENPDLASAKSSICGKTVNRFLHVTESVDDVVMQNRMQRKLGQLEAECRAKHVDPRYNKSDVVCRFFPAGRCAHCRGDHFGNPEQSG